MKTCPATVIEVMFAGLTVIDEVTKKEWKKIKKGKCPDCGSDKWYEGPSGGMCTNYTCANPDCGSKFNISPFSAQRISSTWRTNEV